MPWLVFKVGPNQHDGCPFGFPFKPSKRGGSPTKKSHNHVSTTGSQMGARPGISLEQGNPSAGVTSAKPEDCGQIAPQGIKAAASCSLDSLEGAIRNADPVPMRARCPTTCLSQGCLRYGKPKESIPSLHPCGVMQHRELYECLPLKGSLRVTKFKLAARGKLFGTCWQALSYYISYIPRVPYGLFLVTNQHEHGRIAMLSSPCGGPGRRATYCELVHQRDAD